MAVVLIDLPMDTGGFPMALVVGRTLPTGLAPPIGFFIADTEAVLPVGPELLPAGEVDVMEFVFRNIETDLSCAALGRGVSPRDADGFADANCDVPGVFFLISPGPLLSKVFGESEGRPGIDILRPMLLNELDRSGSFGVRIFLRITVCGVVVMVDACVRSRHGLFSRITSKAASICWRACCRQ